MKKPGTSVLMASILLVGFILGGSIEKYVFDLYGPLSRQVIALEVRLLPISRKNLARNYVQDGDKLPLDRNLDTVLLPIRSAGERLSESLPFPKVAGAITTIGDTVIVLDRLGGLYACPRNGRPVRLPFPPLPNNVEDFTIRNPNFNSKQFRAYSIVYLPQRKQIAVAHEYYQRDLDRERMAVSLIGIDAHSLQPVGAWTTIFRSEPNPVKSNDEGGGRLAATDDGELYLSIGDYGILSSPVAQDPASSFGKIIRIDLETGRSRVFTLGHRNPEGLTVTRSGMLLATEHGPLGGDKLNNIIEGANYGWPDVTLGTDYDSYGWRQQHDTGTHAGYQAPVFAWLPSIAVSGLIEIHGFDPRWDGDLLIGSLKGESLFRLRMNAGSVQYSEQIWIGQRIRDLAQLADGTLVLWTDDAQLHFLSVDRTRLDGSRRLPGISETTHANCMYCHHLGPTNPADLAPSLSGLFHRKIGSENFRYSAALRTTADSWTEARLRTFLANPGKFAPGTAMPTLPLSRETIDEIVQDLQALDEVE
jgi:aldose sugar dehydrogenase